MKFLIVESSSLPILIPLGSKYLPQDPVSSWNNMNFKMSVTTNRYKLAQHHIEGLGSHVQLSEVRMNDNPISIKVL